MAITSQVHAPYHFVPLSKWVYMPDWAHLVSQDVPFKDGYSGIINYTLTNATPLLVGGEQETRDGQPSLIKWARDPKGNPVIPGSSLKGMIRNVLEIATFGKFSAIDDSHFSYRDISSRSHYLEQVIKRNTVKAGWLKYNNIQQNWELLTCQFAKIKHSDIKQCCGVTIRNDETAVDKYKKFPLSKSLTCDIEVREGKQGKVNWSVNLKKGDTDTHVIFCNKRITGRGNIEDYEFSYCFYGAPTPANIESTHLNNRANKLFISHDEQQIEYLKAHQHDEFGIPVFALFDKSGKNLHSLGLSKMPRVLYQYSAADLADVHQTQARTSPHYFDMAELLFGTLREKGLSLKSRVFFSDSQLNKGSGLRVSNNVTLNSPKATFRGAYLEQPVSSQYQDYNNKNTVLSGWKRYVSAPDFKENENTSNNIKVQNQLELMNKNSEFSGQIIFHNLKKEELGALLWALQLGKKEEACNHFHGLGHGKSLGAGAVQLSVNLKSLSANDQNDTIIDKESFIHHFISDIETHYPTGEEISWENSPQIRHLFAIANINANKDRDLSYMPLGNYQSVTNSNAALPPIEIDGVSLPRKESHLIKPGSALSFSRGRLSALFSEEDKDKDKDKDNSNLWYRKQKEKRLIMEEAIEREKMESLEKERLLSLPEDEKIVATLKRTLQKAKTVDEKRLINPDVKTAIDLFMNGKKSQQAAQQLFDLVSDKSVCEYLAITNKKKLKPRKTRLAELATKYNLKSAR